MNYITLYLITATVVLLAINSLIVVFNMTGRTKEMAPISQKNDIRSEMSPLRLSMGTVSASILALAIYGIWVFNLSYSSVANDYNESLHLLLTIKNFILFQEEKPYLFFSFLVVMLTFIVIISVKPYFLKENAILVMLSTAGVLLMGSSTNFISFYLAIELISLSSYILASTKNQSTDHTELSHAPIVAGLKYFLLSALSSGLLVLGISLIYMATGELDLASLSRIVSSNSTSSDLALCGLGLSLVVAFVLFKLGASPFHYWVADVYSQVDLFVNYYLIVVGKIGMLFALMKLSFAMSFPLVQNLILVASIASLLVGSFAGLVQNSIRRLMAFSSINHVGYIMLAYCFSFVETDSIPLGVVNENITQEFMKPNLNSYLATTISSSSLTSLWLYITIYSLSTVCFFAILSLDNRSYQNDKAALIKGKPEEASCTQESAVKSTMAKLPSFLTKLKTEKPFANFFIYLSLTISLLSLAGVPPLAGFIAKIAIFWQVLDSGNWVAATIAVLCSVIAAVYYLRVISLLYFYPKGNFSVKYPSSLADQNQIVFLKALIIAFITVFLVVYPVANPSFIYLYFHNF